MKTIITSTSNSMDATFDKRFGRAAWFCIYDNKSNTTTFIENKYAESSNGAGTKVAEKVVEWEVSQVISGDFGPKAKELLDKFDIQMIIIQKDELIIENVIEKLKQSI